MRQNEAYDHNQAYYDLLGLAALLRQLSSNAGSIGAYRSFLRRLKREDQRVNTLTQAMGLAGQDIDGGEDVPPWARS